MHGWDHTLDPDSQVSGSDICNQSERRPADKSRRGCQARVGRTR
jgi:hypothetical protein